MVPSCVSWRFSVLLKAWKKLGEDGPKLYMYGKGELEDKCRAYIEKNGLSNVTVRGQISYEDLLNVYKNAKALIFPSKIYEGFGLTVIESYSQGTPVIAGDFGNGGSLVKEGKTGFKYTYDSPDSLADTVMRMENLSDESYEVLSKLAYKEYKEKYTEEINYRMLIDIYEKCTGKNKKP